MIKGAFSLNRGPDYPTSLRIVTVPRLRKVQYSRLGVSRGKYYPLPTETETVSATRKAHSTAQAPLEQRAKIPHFHANRYSVDTAEGSNQKGRPPIQYTEIPTAAQTSHIVWKREQGHDQPPLRQSDEPTLVSADAREGIGSARSWLSNGESRSRKPIRQYGAAMARRKRKTRK